MKDQITKKCDGSKRAGEKEKKGRQKQAKNTFALNGERLMWTFFTALAMLALSPPPDLWLPTVPATAAFAIGRLLSPVVSLSSTLPQVTKCVCERVQLLEEKQSKYNEEKYF